MNRLLPLCLLLLSLCWPLAIRAELPDPTRFSTTLELGDVKQAQAWLDEGLDPNFEGSHIGTGLMIGAWEGNLPMMELFLARGADIERTNSSGETAVMLAAWKNRKEAVQWLLERGAKLNRPDRQWTALHYAVFAGNSGLADTLLSAGANINARSTNGSTPVMMAAREGHLNLAKRLLEGGANPALKNDYEDDAVSWAMRQGNFDIAKTFTSAENFAELVRQAAEKPLPPPVRSVPAPDIVDELLRKARLAEMDGKREEALAAYQKAWTELKTRQAPQKPGAAKRVITIKGKPVNVPPKALVISAKRGEPEKQSMSLSYAKSEEGASADQLLERARAAEASGNRTEALRLYREASARLKSGQ